MRISGAVDIPPEKLERYLLVWRPKSDKSQFLAQAGFTPKNPTDLDKALRRLVLENEAIPDRHDVYGEFVQIEGALIGPLAVLPVIAVWVLPVNGSRYRFVTLKPAR